jgi:hypothetical protein
VLLAAGFRRSLHGDPRLPGRPRRRLARADNPGTVGA